MKRWLRTCPRWVSLTRAAERPRHFGGRFSSAILMRVTRSHDALIIPHRPERKAAPKSTQAITRGDQPTPATLETANVSQQSTQAHRKKLAKPIHTADSVYHARTSGLAEYQARREAATNVTESREIAIFAGAEEAAPPKKNARVA